MDRWNELKSIEDNPIKLPELLEIQKQRISKVVTEKNRVIQQFRNDIKRMDECYSNFADKQVCFKLTMHCYPMYTLFTREKKD